MIIRKYEASDEQGWLQCRVLAFLDTSYYNDVKTKKEVYENSSICLVAEEHNRIIGLIDVEIDSNSLTMKLEKGAMIWNLAVLPEYRRQSIAFKLWEKMLFLLKEMDVKVCELWTQEDKAANEFYQSIGFIQDPTNTWIRCYMKPENARTFIDKEKLGKIFGIEEFIFEATLDRFLELQEVCTRIDEVRLYTRKL